MLAILWPQLVVLVELAQHEGKIGALGLSAIDLNGLNHAIPVGIVCVQNAYNLISRQYEDMLDLCGRYH